jgi:hypothetical protein
MAQRHPADQQFRRWTSLSANKKRSLIMQLLRAHIPDRDLPGAAAFGRYD